MALTAHASAIFALGIALILCRGTIRTVAVATVALIIELKTGKFKIPIATGSNALVDAVLVPCYKLHSSVWPVDVAAYVLRLPGCGSRSWCPRRADC